MIRLLTLFALLAGCTGEVADTADTDIPEEICNGIDDNGDGRIDELVLTDWYVDLDGDGYGTDASGTATCDPPEHGVQTGGDCDDSTADISPEELEDCDTEADDNCDGAVNEDGGRHCVDTWPDADGDGHGEGDSTCTCGVAEGRVVVGPG